LNAQIGSAEATADELDARITAMVQRRASIYLDLEEIVDLAKVQQASLTQVTHSGSSITVKGAAPNVGRLYDYARDLRKSPRFSKIWIPSITESGGGFSFTFSLTK